MKIALWFTFFVASALIPIEASAESRLDAVIREAIARSPQVLAQKRQAEIAQADRYRRFWFNEPQVSYINADDNNTQTYGVSLVVPFPGRVFASMKLDTAKAHAQESEFRAKRIEIAKMMTQAALDCAAGNETAKLQKETLQDYETLAQTLRRLYESGHAALAEKIGSDLQVRQAQLDLRTGEEKAEVNCRKLSLVAEKSGSRSDLQVDLPDDLSKDIIQELGSSAPDQLRADAGIHTAEVASSTAIAAQLPDLTLAYGQNHYWQGMGSPTNKEWTTTYSIALTLPLFFFTKESPEVDRARSQAVSDLNAAQIQKVVADADVEDAIREFQRSRDRLNELREKDLALAEALVESTASAYRSGKLGYAELVLSRKTLSDLRSQDIQLRSGVILARLRCLDQCERKLNQEGMAHESY